MLLCVALEHFVLVVLRVRRGAGHADHSVSQIKHALHCQMCSQRAFIPNTLSVPGMLKSSYNIFSNLSPVIFDNYKTPLPCSHWRARRALSLFKVVLSRTRRVLSLYKVYGESALLVFNRTSLNSDSTLLALN